MKPTRIFIDGPNMAHGLRHSYLKELRDEEGFPTGVLFGTMHHLDKLMAHFDPDEIAVVWEDTDVPSWRHAVYKGYKADRKAAIKQYTPEEEDDHWDFVNIQLVDVKKAFTRMGIPQITVPGLEADDVLGALVAERDRDDCNYVIVSTDKDMLQLCKWYRCRVFNPREDHVYYQSEKGYLRYSKTKGIVAPSPNTWLIWRAIVGDKSDSIDGIYGVGPGTVAKLYGMERWNREPAWEYVTRATLTGKRGTAIEEGQALIQRNLDLMDLCGYAAIRRMPKEEKYAQARNFLHVCLGLAPNKTKRPRFEDWPLFLREAKKDPNPMLKFYRRRGFDFAYDIRTWRAWVDRYRVLYRRRLEALCNNGAFLVPE